MSRKILSALSGCLLGLLLSGCSTVWTVASGVREPYSGTKIDSFILSSRDASAGECLYAVVDFPFSLVGDAIFVVFTRPDGVQQLVSPDYN